ncbi:MAG: PD-(D/E)XK nuclease family protein [Eudoraea sp.]|nr:PD-(D/E)XK nuclease family protein [Eudoraea sp.]
MQSFLEEVVADIIQKKQISDDLVLVVPSKRAGVFLLQQFSKNTKRSSFAPTIVTIEEFIKQLSGLRYASGTQLFFELYSVYQSHHKEQAESFYDFSKWGNMLLQDFNEIDRYLIPPHKIFSYLSAIQETNHWYLQPHKTPMIEAYIRFWKELEPLYNKFKDHLMQLGVGYQGMIYRKAHENIHEYAKTIQEGTHFFIGFNALNAAESDIIQTLLSEQKAEVFWDVDPIFLEDHFHDAGVFIRSYLKNWRYYSSNAPKGPKPTYNSEKSIKIIGVPKNVSQAKYVGSLIRELNNEDKASLNSTAIILGNEKLLNPLLNSMPGNISNINVTMGYPVGSTPAASLFNEFVSLYVTKQDRGWYYNDLLSFISHPYIQSLFKTPLKTTSELTKAIKEKNWVYIQPQRLPHLINTDKDIMALLFSEHFTTPMELLKACHGLLLSLRDHFTIETDAITLEYLVQLHTVFNEMKQYMNKYDFISDLKSFQSLYKELLDKETLDFYGEPLEGIQIMGMLESRNLDFETVVITSVNEGILPSGKTNSSFIPFDLKKEFKLPTYKEKDAVYTYHFYRLLQRAKNVYLLYNTEPDVLEGGEKSRFITQLLTEDSGLKNITHSVASPAMELPIPENETVEKELSVLTTLKERAEKGFSPSSLSQYIRNPIDFYKRYVLGIKESIDVEEVIAANTFGTVIHSSMEALYTPLIGSRLSPEKLKTLIPDIPKVVTKHYLEHYPNVSLESGQNLIAYHVIQRYIEKFITSEIKECARHTIEILALEEPFKTPIVVPGVPFPVFLRGTLDRVDKKDGILRILDYKTGNAKDADVQITDWDTLINDPDKSKAFQLLCYALMYRNKHNTGSFEAAIIPFRNLDAGLLTFAVKESGSRSAKNSTISAETLDLFQEQLLKLIETICDQNEAFIAKEV